MGSSETEIIPSNTPPLNSPETSKHNGGTTFATSQGVSTSVKSTRGGTSQSGITQGGREPTDTTLIENTTDGFSLGSSTKSKSTEASTPAASTAGDTTPFQSTTGSIIATSNPTISSTNIQIESTITFSQTITSPILVTTIPLTTSYAGTSISTTPGEKRKEALSLATVNLEIFQVALLELIPWQKAVSQDGPRCRGSATNWRPRQSL